MFRMNSRMIFFQLLLGVVLIFSSCKKNVNKIASSGWNPSLAVPLGEANFLISDLLKNVDSGIVVGPLGEISIAFEETVDSISASDLITLDNYTQNFDLTPSGLVATQVFPSGNIISASSPISTSYTAPNGVEIHDLNFSNGQLVLAVSSDFQHDIHLVFTLNDLIINGSPFTQTMDLIYTGSLPVTGMVSVPLAGASADFTAGNTLVNSLTGSVDATITASGNPGNPILGTEKLSLDLSLNNLGYDNITGYFGQQTLANLTDSILFKLFQNSEMSGNIAFSNPSMTFNIENSFGVPVDINLGSFQSIDSISGQVTNMVLSNNVLSVNTPVTMGQTATTSFKIDRNNMTNIESLIGTKPRYMKFNIAATTNPAGKTGTLNFLEASSKILIKAELDLPFEGSASGITAGDTMDFNFNNNIDMVESVMFRLNVDNGFPVSFKAQATFVDQNYQPVFTLFTSPKEVVTAAPVNSSTGKVTGTVNKITDLTIDADKAKQLNLVKYIIIQGTVDTTDPDNTNVKFYEDYGISLKLGMQVNLKM